MVQRCHICIEEDCKGARNCHCDDCAKAAECPKVLRPTIRLTTKCTQSCGHCCFDCSPKRTDMMTVEQARQIKQFLTSNDISIISLMGGEICCNPDWREIVSVLLPGLSYCRFVTNGDTVVEAGAAEFLSQFDFLKVSVSKDRWHTNEKVDEALALLKANDIFHNVAVEEQGTEESIVPAGRGDMFFGPYSMFGTHCSNPEHRYSFLIDEVGKVFKCGFGSWYYADVEDYLEGDFAERFKEFNQTFFKAFVPNCATCIRCSRSADRKRNDEN